MHGHIYGEIAQIHLSSMTHHDPLKQLQEILLLVSDSPRGGKYVGNNGSCTQPKIAGGGAVRGSEGHPAADDDLASEKRHLLALF